MAAERRIKGLVRAEGGARLIRRGDHRILSREAEEHLFRLAEVLSEGGLREGEEAYYGSTMLTVDLDRLARYWRGALDDATAMAIAAAVEGSVRVHLRATRLAVAEAFRRVPASRNGTPLVETRVGLAGRHLHLDVDLEIPFGVASRLLHRR